MAAVGELSAQTGIAAACATLGVSRASFYRHRSPKEKATRRRTTPPRALTQAERDQVLAVLHEERFVDKAPTEVYAALLDEGRYYCSVRTMYRILESVQEVRERRNQRRHPVYTKPELLATKPNEVWSWDITKLRGPRKWQYYYLYVIIDIFSRYTVGWLLAERETAALAHQFIDDTVQKHGIEPGQLTIHADRGTSMTSKPVALLLADLGVTKTHSRPHTSNDNPYSEAQFKTLKYCPEFPDHFSSLEEARAFCQRFFTWYNKEHYHTGISLLTPHMVHYGQAEQAIKRREQVLSQAYASHPERFVNKPPTPTPVPTAAWINPPKQ